MSSSSCPFFALCPRQAPDVAARLLRETLRRARLQNVPAILHVKADCGQEFAPTLTIMDKWRTAAMKRANAETVREARMHVVVIGEAPGQSEMAPVGLPPSAVPPIDPWASRRFVTVNGEKFAFDPTGETRLGFMRRVVSAVQAETAREAAPYAAADAAISAAAWRGTAVRIDGSCWDDVIELDGGFHNGGITAVITQEDAQFRVGFAFRVPGDPRTGRGVDIARRRHADAPVRVPMIVKDGAALRYCGVIRALRLVRKDGTAPHWLTRDLQRAFEAALRRVELEEARARVEQPSPAAQRLPARQPVVHKLLPSSGIPACGSMHCDDMLALSDTLVTCDRCRFSRAPTAVPQRETIVHQITADRRTACGGIVKPNEAYSDGSHNAPTVTCFACLAKAQEGADDSHR